CHQPPSFICTDPPTTHIYTLSLHDALPISFYIDPQEPLKIGQFRLFNVADQADTGVVNQDVELGDPAQRGLHGVFLADVENQNRSEEHTSELQSRFDLVCRLLLEKKN